MFNAKDCVNSKYRNTQGEEYTILEYTGKVNNKHMYDIKFTSTGNIYNYSRDIVKQRKTPKDKLHIAELNKAKKKQKTSKRKRMNSPITDTLIYTNKENPTILTIDQATVNSGFCLIKDGELKDYGLISVVGANVDIRMNKVYNIVKKKIIDNKVDILILEDIYLSFNAVTYKQLAKLQGILINLAIEMNLDYGCINAVKWKSEYGLLKYKGKKQKEMGMKMVKELGLSIETDDVSDAVLLGMYGYNHAVVNMGGFKFE